MCCVNWSFVFVFVRLSKQIAVKFTNMSQLNYPYYAHYDSNFEIDLDDVKMDPEVMDFPFQDQPTEFDNFDTETDHLLLTINEPAVLENEPKIVEKEPKIVEKERKIVDKDKLVKFIDGGVNKETKAKTDRDARRFLDFLHVTGEERPLNEISKSEMDAYLGTFFMDLRKKNGDMYEPTTITSFFW